MKKNLLLMTGIACLLLFFGGTLHAQWAYNGTHIYNTNTGNVAIGHTSPSYLLHVGQNTTGPTIAIHNMGGIGGAQFEMIDLNSTADWKFKATNAGGFKIRDHATGLDVFFIEQNSLANALYIKQGGNVGIGTTTPPEKLEVNGAVKLGSTSGTNAGTIRWNGSNFEGFNGSSWLTLDLQQDNDWFVQPNIPFGNPELVAPNIPASITNIPPGLPNFNGFLYITDLAAPGLFPHLIALEGVTGGPNSFDVSQLYRLSANLSPPFIDYSVGIHAPDMTYKVCFGSILTPTAQSDNSTMMRAYQNGIIDFSNQSRCRAYQVPDPIQANWQVIMPTVWTPINFDADAPLNMGWDEQNEFTVAPLNLPTPPANAFFTATVEGYYTVDARTAFNVDTWDEPAGGGVVQVAPYSYVLIAIWVDDLSGNGFQLHALGNKLQIAEWMMLDLLDKMLENNAPNVVDQVYLGAGHMVAIYVYHTAVTPMNLIPGNAETYVSINKDS